MPCGSYRCVRARTLMAGLHCGLKRLGTLRSAFQQSDHAQDKETGERQVERETQ